MGPTLREALWWYRGLLDPGEEPVSSTNLIEWRLCTRRRPLESLTKLRARARWSVEALAGSHWMCSSKEVSCVKRFVGSSICGLTCL